ncbi:MAG: type I pullulanase [Agathobacter sp.]|nr:type I pullulanase [Agathobacter sp.]
MKTLQTYNGNDLGAVYSKQNTHFRLWAPTAERVQICFYATGDGGEAVEVKDMQPDEGGTWVYAKSGDLHQLYYTYLVTVNGQEQETNDPYGKATGVNGKRSMVVNLEKTNPEGFEDDHGPEVKKWTDIVVYELSVLDTTSAENSGVVNKGKYIGLTETGTKTPEGIPTGLDHILDLGVTHVQIMPSYDFGSIDESKPEEPQYNWGYDPINYNVPEGSFSTDPFHGEVRIKEYKEMVQSFHKHGLGVIMDVVYNHTYDIENNCFQKCVPDYYYRITEDGEYSDASACGNEVASDHPMVRKFIIDSLKYWVSEYHIDGFRFDLMGVLDIETMNQAAVELKKINPSIIIYGEGWTGGPSTIPDEERALKCNVPALVDVGAFSDDIRDAVRGDVFIEEEIGFISGRQNMENDIRYSVVGATRHPEVDYDAYEYSEGPWAKNPVDIVNYVSCHDNLTLWDKISVSCPKATREEKLAMNRLATAMVFTAQGIPFFLSGEEFARTKPIEGTDKVAENSYNLPFYTNVMRYESVEENRELYEYYKGLIAFRKAHEGLRFGTTEEVQKALHFVDGMPKNVVAFTIKTDEETIFVAYNANKKAVKIDLPEKAEWQICVDNDKASKDALRTLTAQDAKVEVQGVACLVAVMEEK